MNLEALGVKVAALFGLNCDISGLDFGGLFPQL
jgi:hypothetical protein